jgi:hypothetical protein
MCVKCMHQTALMWWVAVNRMGAQARWCYDAADVTHIVYHAAPASAARRRSSTRQCPKEVRDAMAAGKTAVCGDWLRQCYAQRLRLDPRNYPWTGPSGYEENRLLLVTAGACLQYSCAPCLFRSRPS